MFTMTLLEKKRLAPNILEMVLQAPADFNFSAGQYILMGFDSDDLKPFSIANAPRKDNRLTLQIKNTDHSDWMQQIFEFPVNGKLYVEGPKDQYPSAKTKGHLFFIAGGTGYSPMCALLEDLIAKPNQADIQFYWGAKTLAELYHHQQISELAERTPNIRYIPVLSEQTEDWQGATGWVHLQALKDFNQLTQTEKAQAQVYLCGPWEMRQLAQQDFIAAGLAETNFH